MSSRTEAEVQTLNSFLRGEISAVETYKQALEQGEDHGLADYKRDADQLHGELRRFARMQLLPAQQRTHDRMSKLKKTLH